MRDLNKFHIALFIITSIIICGVFKMSLQLKDAYKEIIKLQEINNKQNIQVDGLLEELLILDSCCAQYYDETELYIFNEDGYEIEK